MVREGCQKSGEEVEKDGPAGRVGKSHHNTECQHEMLNNTQVMTPEQLSGVGALQLARLAPKLGLLTASVSQLASQLVRANIRNLAVKQTCLLSSFSSPTYSNSPRHIRL